MPANMGPSLSAFSDQGRFVETAGEVCQDFNKQLKLTPSDHNKASDHVNISTDRPQHGEAQPGKEDEDDDDFSFASNADHSSPISADDAFHKGQIKPSFPLFNRDLLYYADDDDSENAGKRLPHRPPVQKVFFEAPPLPPSSSSETDQIEGIASGPYCVWSKKSGEQSPAECKKSNSTGFSKLWRFKDLLGRSNSDGKDAFVFLSGSSSTPTTATTAQKEDKAVEKSEASSEKKGAVEVKAKVARDKAKAKKGVKRETASLSAYEIYMKNRALEDDRRRSYLPYRPDLVGFFTNVNGGLSRNVHPF